MPRKTEFELHFGDGEKHKSGQIKIVGERPEHAPYVAIYLKDPKVAQTTTACWIDDKEIERFAVNILKALGSKKLADNDTYTRWVYPCEKI